MKRDIRSAMMAGAVALALACPAAVLSQVGEGALEPQQKPQTPVPSQTMGHPQGRQEAHDMVRATVTLNKALDARKDQDGSQFVARLAHAVQLKDGPELGKGTILMGTVETDDMQVEGRSKLAVRFTEAKQKDGQTVPIRATIVQLYPPLGLTADGSQIPDESGPQWDMDGHANEWNPRELRVDQIGALKNVDLHSNVASQNSGVFVSTRTDDVKVMQGSRLELALGAAGNGQQAENR